MYRPWTPFLLFPNGTAMDMAEKDQQEKEKEQKEKEQKREQIRRNLAVIPNSCQLLTCFEQFLNEIMIVNNGLMHNW